MTETPLADGYYKVVSGVVTQLSGAGLEAHTEADFVGKYKHWFHREAIAADRRGSAETAKFYREVADEIGRAFDGMRDGAWVVAERGPQPDSKDPWLPPDLRELRIAVTWWGRLGDPGEHLRIEATALLDRKV